jgi:hypothetical protein
MADRVVSDAEFLGSAPSGGMSDAEFLGQNPAADIDTTTGAPLSVRQSVGSSQSGGDRLTAIRQWYPDAEPYGSDNFTFTNPDNGKRTLYNPKGVDGGDLVSVIPEMWEAAGGGVGAGLGAFVGIPGGPPGIMAGAVMGAGTGGVAANSIYDFLAPYLYDSVDTRSTGQIIQDTVTDFGMNAMGEGVGRQIPGLVSNAWRGVFGRPGGNAAALAADFSASGITPRQPGIFGGRGMQALETGLNNTVFGGGIIDDAITSTRNELATKVGELAGSYRAPGAAPRMVGATSYDAGRDLVRAGADFVGEFKVESKRLYDELDALLPNGQTTLVDVSSTQTALDDVLNKFTTATDLGGLLQPKIFAAYAEALGKADFPGSLTWQETKAFRSKIGTMIGDPVARNDTDLAALKSLYAALSDDMMNAARAAGPDAEAALTAANIYFRNGVSAIDGALADITNPNATTESAWRSIQRLGLENTSRESARDLAVIRRTIDPAAWDTYASAILNTMGDAKAGAQDAAGEVFSVNTFLTNWNKLSPTAKSIMFKGTRYDGLSDALERLVRVASGLKDAGRLANTSNTAASMNAARMINTLGLGVGTVAGGLLTGDLAGAASGAAAGASAVLAPRTIARLITSPQFVSWLAETPMQRTAAQARSAAGATMAGHIGRLTQIAIDDPSIAEAVYQFLDALGTTEAPPLSLSQNLTSGMPPQPGPGGRLTHALRGNP